LVVAERPFGGLAMIVGTLETSLIALALAVLVGLGTSIAIVFLVPRRLRNIIATLVELLAAVPSVVYGLWGTRCCCHLGWPSRSILG